MRSRWFILFLALSITPACSHFTVRGRQDRTYAKHLKKLRIDRERRLARLRRDVPKIPSPEAMAPSEPQVTIQISEGPEAPPSDQ